MGRFGDELLERVERAVDRTFQMVLSLPNNVLAWEIGRQIVRSAGSSGANLEEAKGCLSRKDFAHRFSVSLRETRETLYWLRRIEKNRLIPARRLGQLQAEWNELVSIMTSVLKKLRSSSRTGEAR